MGEAPAMSGRDQILESVRRQLKRGAALEAGLQSPKANLIPARGQLDRARRLDLFVDMAKEAACSVVRLSRREDVPGAVADYLKGENLPASIRLAPDPAVTGLPWTA